MAHVALNILVPILVPIFVVLHPCLDLCPDLRRTSSMGQIRTEHTSV